MPRATLSLDVESARGSKKPRRTPAPRKATVDPMTFVAALIGLPNGGYVANDIRVGSFGRRGEFRPWLEVGLQKVHPICPFVVAGFAGSVELGFWAIGDLDHYVGDLPPGVAVYPTVIARWWWRRARRVFARAPEHLRELGLSVVLVGASPDPTPLTVSHGFIFHSPRFEPERISSMKPRGIGSGTGLDQVTDALAELVAPENLNEGLLRFEVGMPMGGADALGLALGNALSDEPSDEVSAEFQTWRIRRGEILRGSNETTALTPGAESRAMPPLATSWVEFQNMTRQAGRAPSAAIA